MCIVHIHGRKAVSTDQELCLALSIRFHDGIVAKKISTSRVRIPTLVRGKNSLTVNDANKTCLPTIQIITIFSPQHKYLNIQNLPFKFTFINSQTIDWYIIRHILPDFLPEYGYLKNSRGAAAPQPPPPPPRTPMLLPLKTVPSLPIQFFNIISISGYLNMLIYWITQHFN